MAAEENSQWKLFFELGRPTFISRGKQAMKQLKAVLTYGQLQGSDSLSF